MRELMQQRLAQLEANKEQAFANAHAFEGAIQECQYWLKQIENAERDMNKIVPLKTGGQ